MADPDDLSQGELMRWVRRLDADDFHVRREARLKLLAAGDRAVEALRDAATAESPVAYEESISLLARLAHDGDPQLADLADATLRELAQRDTTAESQLAAQVIAPSSPILMDGELRNGIALRFQVNGPAGPGILPRFRQVQTVIVNGRRTIEVVEQQRRLEFTDNQGRQIRATQTETRDGKEVVLTVEAADITELRTKSPGLAQAFERYTQEMQAGFGRRGLPDLRR
jgi:hypothetical protein